MTFLFEREKRKVVTSFKHWLSYFQLRTNGLWYCMYSKTEGYLKVRHLEEFPVNFEAICWLNCHYNSLIYLIHRRFTNFVLVNSVMSANCNFVNDKPANCAYGRTTRQGWVSSLFRMFRFANLAGNAPPFRTYILLKILVKGDKWQKTVTDIWFLNKISLIHSNYL